MLDKVNKWLSDKFIKYLYKSMDNSIKTLEDIDKFIRKYNLENTQEYLNWQDKINKISVR
jgi:hypothetical protein